LQGGYQINFLFILSIFTGRNLNDVANFVSPLKKNFLSDESDRAYERVADGSVRFRAVIMN
jgi:hypothetical protein